MIFPHIKMLAIVSLRMFHLYFKNFCEALKLNNLDKLSSVFFHLHFFHISVNANMSCPTSTDQLSFSPPSIHFSSVSTVALNRTFIGYDKTQLGTSTVY